MWSLRNGGSCPSNKYGWLQIFLNCIIAFFKEAGRYPGFDGSIIS